MVCNVSCIDEKLSKAVVLNGIVVGVLVVVLVVKVVVVGAVVVLRLRIEEGAEVVTKGVVGNESTYLILFLDVNTVGTVVVVATVVVTNWLNGTDRTVAATLVNVVGGANVIVVVGTVVVVVGGLVVVVVGRVVVVVDLVVVVVGLVVVVGVVVVSGVVVIIVVVGGFVVVLLGCNVDSMLLKKVGKNVVDGYAVVVLTVVVGSLIGSEILKNVVGVVVYLTTFGVVTGGGVVAIAGFKLLFSFTCIRIKYLNFVCTGCGT